MANIVISGDSSGSVTLSAPAVSGTTVLTLPTTSGTLVVAGGAQTVQFAAGSAAAPSITFTGDTNTGIFSPAADTIAFSEGGVESMRINASGNVGIGGEPTGRLALWASGGVQQYIISTSATSQDNAIVSLCNSGAAYSMQAFDALSYKWATQGTERMRIDTSGNVGIGTSSPAARVDNTGTFRTTGATDPASGVGLELSYRSTYGDVLAYNRTTAAFAELQLRGSPIIFGNGGGERMRITSAGNVGIGISNPNTSLEVVGAAGGGTANAPSGTMVLRRNGGGTQGDYGPAITFGQYWFTGSTDVVGTGQISGVKTVGSGNFGGGLAFFRCASGSSNFTEAMRIDDTGALLVAKTVRNIATSGFQTDSTGQTDVTVSASECMNINRNTNDGDLIRFRQDNAVEGSISVSGTTVSYNGGHLSRWSQWQNQTGKPEVYRGSVLESTNDMCEWNQANEQSTKTIVSTTAKSKAIAGVFDMYDTDDEDNPYDFYVAQSGDFIIRIAQGIVVVNGDLLESAGDGTARPQTDDICRSSTVAKVTSNHVTCTYADGSYCVPCVLMAC